MMRSRTESTAAANDWFDHDEKATAAFRLRSRALAALNRAGVTRVGQLRTLLAQGRLDVVGVGAKSLASLTDALAAHDLDDQDPISQLALPRPMLDPREREIFRLRSSGATLGEIARQYGISLERVRQILARLPPRD